MCMVAGCGKVSDQPAESKQETTAEIRQTTEADDMKENSEGTETNMKTTTLSGIIPDELEYIPDSYYKAARAIAK